MSVVKTFITLGFLALAALAQAQTSGSESFSRWDVHYSLVPTRFLQAEVAARYGIEQGDDRMLLTLAVTERDKPLAGGVAVNLKGSRTNLIDRFPLMFNTVQEGEATSYVTALRVSPRERWIFEIDLQPQGLPHPYRLQIDQRFDEQP